MDVVEMYNRAGGNDGGGLTAEEIADYFSEYGTHVVRRGAG